MAATIASLQEERTISEVRRLSHAGLAGAELLQRVAKALHRTVPFEMYSAATIDPASSLITHAFAEEMGRREGAPRPANPAWFEHFYFEEGYEQTLDLVRRRKWATTIADETDGRLDQSLCYRESMQPAGIEHKAHAIFVDRNLWGDIELYRETGRPAFTEREIDLMRRVAPDVGAGLKAAALRAQSVAAGAGEQAPGVLVIDPKGRVTTTGSAERLLSELAELQPGWRDRGDLPVAVQVVLGALRQTLAGAPNAVAPRLQVRARSGRWISLHASGSEASEERPSQQFVVVSPTSPQEIVWLGMSAYDLSAREEEVVKLVVGGLSTRQISDQLFIAEHTVQRHLSNIFEKVGVRGRRALVKQLFVEQMLPSMN